jgi:hypothetical protein
MPLLKVDDTTYAVLDPEKHFASDRAENSRSFSQKNSQSESFCEKEKTVLTVMLPPANRAVIRLKRPVCRSTA